ncbi:MAG: helix-turn-helix domain-containing protein [Deltaproteobacteria bacterium]|nr:helix-turn-helix domain-containing protein [Deltaproteobacteria bacterium]MBW2139073.1 helix-turn-helix domain-containing protein [Deltaproteobacteria bacterium]
MEALELKMRLKRLGWSYAEAARQLGVSRGTITRWVKGERRISETAIRLINVLGEDRTLQNKTGHVILDTIKLSPFEKELLRKLVLQLSNITEVRRILVFGSRARGYSNEHSDLDVVVVTDTMDPASRASVEKAKWEALPEDAFLYANVIAITEGQLATDTVFSRTLSKEGIEIWTRSEKVR